MTILAEKENVARNYAKALKLKKTDQGKYENGDGTIILTYAAGHLYTSYAPEDYDIRYKKWTKDTLPIIPRKYLYKPEKTKSEIRKNCEAVLREAVRKKDEIVIATDPDREGEVIARLILNALKVPYENVTRVWACEGLDEKQILKGIKERKSASSFNELADQGLYQKESDWVMGINLSRCYTIINNKLFSVGRVQTAVLKEIYRKQIEIMLFKPQAYYECKVNMADGTSGFLINLATGKKAFSDRHEMDMFIKICNGRNALCENEIREEKTEYPPRLYDLAGLQKDCYSLYTIGVDQTLNYAQDLYNIRGVLSYPRSDSVCLGDGDVMFARELYGKLKEKRNISGFALPENINSENRRLFNSQEVRGHHGIIPSNFYDRDGTDEWKVWDLVFRRFMMAGMGNYVYENIRAYFSVDGYRIMAEGRNDIRKGWKEANPFSEKKFQSFSFTAGQQLKIEGMEILEKKTEPPRYYDQGSIISFMRNPGGTDGEGVRLSSIGTESTQANIIRTLFKRGYIKTVGKHIEITGDGVRLVEQIMDNPLLDMNTSVESTTRWEKLNRENPKALLEEIEEITRKSVEVLKKDMDTVIERKVYGKCPACGGDILKGRKGFYCSNWKEKGCRQNLSFHLMGNEITEDMVVRLLDEGQLDVMEGVTKEGGRVNFVIKIQEDGINIVFLDNSHPVCRCPKCGTGNIVAMKKVFKCTESTCGLYFYKQSSGVTYTGQMISELCEGKEVKGRQIKKDGSEVDVKLKIRNDWTIGLCY